jgi:hypothetical protein
MGKLVKFCSDPSGPVNWISQIEEGQSQPAPFVAASGTTSFKLMPSARALMATANMERWQSRR